MSETATKINETLQDLKSLVEQVKNLEIISEGRFTIKAHSHEELVAAASTCKCHLYKPFEKAEWDNFFYFDYCLPENRKLCITVRGPEEYRYDKVLKEI
jgi:hypothetical protein